MKAKKKIRYSILGTMDGRVKAIVLKKDRRGLGKIPMVITIGVVRKNQKRSRVHQ